MLVMVSVRVPNVTKLLSLNAEKAYRLKEVLPASHMSQLPVGDPGNTLVAE